MVVRGRKAEQTLRAVLQAHADRLRDLHAPEAAFFAGEISELVSRFDLVVRDMQGFPDGHLDVRVLDNLDPVQQALVHYLAGQQYLLTNGIVVPYATPFDSGKAEMFAYVHKHHPTTAQQLMVEELQKREQEAARMRERGKEFQETAYYGFDGYVEDRNAARDAGEPFTKKTEQQFGNEIIQRAERKAEEWRTAIADPAAHYSLLGEILDPMECNDVLDETREPTREMRGSRERMRDRVVWITGFDSRISDTRNLFGRVQPVSLYAITDTYRLMTEEKLKTIATLAR